MKLKEKTFIRNFDMEEASVTGFCNFCRNNLPLILAVSVMLFFTYGIKLFWYSIGIDTELFMADKASFLNWIQIGRFGLVLLSKFWYINQFNPFAAFFTAFCLIGFFTISWCYIIAIFSRNTGRNNKLIPFALVFMTMLVWAEQFYFLPQAAETAFIISLCPYVIYLLYKGFLDGEKGKILCASILLVFMTSVYQAIVPLFCCGIFACFVLLQEQTDYEPQVYRNLCLKLFITLVGAMAVYLFVDRVVIPVLFHIEKSAYVDNMNQWDKAPVRQNIRNILIFGYTTTIGHSPLVQSIVNPIIASYARTGMQAAYALTNTSLKISGNILLLPITVLFLITIITVMHKIIPKGRKLLYILAGIGIPLCIMLLTIMGGNRPPLRSLWALPLAFAFMFFYLIISYKKKIAACFACLALLTAFYQAQITAQLFYSDQVRYNEDVRLAYELNDLITQVQPDNEKLPVALIGRYQTASVFRTNFLQGEVIGHSFFEWDFPPSSPTARGLTFMKSLGFYYNMPNNSQLDKAHEEAIFMPVYPDPGCVKRMQDYIVVKISETLY